MATTNYYKSNLLAHLQRNISFMNFPEHVLHRDQAMKEYGCKTQRQEDGTPCVPLGISAIRYNYNKKKTPRGQKQKGGVSHNMSFIEPSSRDNAGLGIVILFDSKSVEEFLYYNLVVGCIIHKINKIILFLLQFTNSIKTIIGRTKAKQ